MLIAFIVFVCAFVLVTRTKKSSLRPGSAVREKGKKGVKWKKYRRPKRAKRWPGDGERAANPPFRLIQVVS